MAIRPPKKKINRKKSLKDYAPTSPMYRQFANPELPKSERRINERAFKIALKRKDPRYQVNVDDVQNVKSTGILAGTGFRKKTQSKGPAGKVMKKKRGGKVSGEDANLTRKLKKNL